MKWRNLVGGVLVLGLLGGASVVVAGEKQFKIDAITLTVEQFVTPGITYHTKEELEAMFKEKVTALMSEKSLLSDGEGIASLTIAAHYQRRFVGDMTPAPSDALGYPDYSYRIDVKDGARTVEPVVKDKMTYSGGFAMNMKVMAAALRDKSYEVQFIEGLAKGIVEEIEELR